MTASDGLMTLHHLVVNHWKNARLIWSTSILSGWQRTRTAGRAGAAPGREASALQFMDGASGKLGEVLLQDTAMTSTAKALERLAVSRSRQTSDYRSIL